MKVAVTFIALFIVVTQVPVPLHAPLQPVNVEPPVGVAVNVTISPQLKLLLQLELQLIPAGELVTFPVPPVTEFTVRLSGKVNPALTVLFASINKLQLPVPVHAPVHPVKEAPLSGVAVSVTFVP